MAQIMCSGDVAIGHLGTVILVLNVLVSLLGYIFQSSFLNLNAIRQLQICFEFYVPRLKPKSRVGGGQTSHGFNI